LGLDGEKVFSPRERKSVTRLSQIFQTSVTLDAESGWHETPMQLVVGRLIGVPCYLTGIPTKLVLPKCDANQF